MYRYLYLALLFLPLFPGCADTSRPSDLPPLFPTTISVTQGGVPLAGAHVELIPQDSPDHPYRPMVITDENGNAMMRTYGFPGAPAGKYKIIVRKNIVDDIVYGTDRHGERTIISSSRYNLVEARYGNVAETPHEVEVAASSRGTQVTIDVGAAIRVKVE